MSPIFSGLSTDRGVPTVLADLESDLLQLKNLGAASVNILRAVGISSIQDLRTAGAVETYTRIKRRGINVSKVMLYALEGALIDTHWKDLDPSLKTQLVSEAEKILATEFEAT